MALDGDTLGDLIKDTIGAFVAGLAGAWSAGNYAARMAAAYRALGGAVISHLVGNPFDGDTPGLVPSASGVPATHALRADGSWGAAGAALSDGNYGDVTVSGGGASIQINAGVITDADVNAANKDGVAGTASMRTLGTGAQQAAAGNHTHAGTYQPADAALTALATLGGAASAGIWRQTGANAVVRVSSSDVLDLIDSTRGAVLYRGASGWTALGPGTSGQYFRSGGAGADPSWTTPPRATTIHTPVGFITSTQSGTLNIGSTECPAWYMGRSQAAIAQAVVRMRLTIGMTGVTWAELFIAKGSLTLGSAPSLSVMGYTSVAATFTGTGLVDTTINVTASGGIGAGDDWWIGFAKLSTGTPQFRAGTFGDDMLSGIVVDASGSNRPSTLYNGGAPTPTSFPIANKSKVTPWLRVQVS